VENGRPGDPAAVTFEVEINGSPARLEIRRDGAVWAFRYNDEAGQHADCTQPESGVYSILWNGRSYEARVERNTSGLTVTVDGIRHEVNISDPRRWRGRGGLASGAGKQMLVAAMPGKVVRILVRPGDVVEAGQGVAVVEAMKMQNEIKTQRAGAVISVTVTEGAAVSAGEILAVIE
jgi:biotin carboxyl carrier protein